MFKVIITSARINRFLFILSVGRKKRPNLWVHHRDRLFRLELRNFFVYLSVCLFVLFIFLILFLCLCLLIFPYGFSFFLLIIWAFCSFNLSILVPVIFLFLTPHILVLSVLLFVCLSVCLSSNFIPRCENGKYLFVGTKQALVLFANNL